MKIFRRIRRRLGTLLVVTVVFFAVVFFISTRSHFVLQNEAQDILDSELLSIGETVAHAFDAQAAIIIRKIDQLGLEQVEGCSAKFQAIARFLVGSVDHVQDVGFVESDGTLSCSVLRPSQPVEGFLKPWSLSNLPMTLAVLEDLKLERRPLALVVNKGLNKRFVIRFAPSILPEDVGSRIVKPYLRYDALLTTGERWIHWEASPQAAREISPIVRWALSSSQLPERFNKSVNSTSFPITVSVSADTDALLAIYDLLDDGAHRVGILAGMVILCLLIAIAWQSKKADLDYNAVFDKGEFVAHYQPVVDMGTGGIIGCEVLLRFRSNEGKLVQPSAFIAYAETTGVIMEVTHDLMVRVARELDELSKDFGHLKVGINLTGKHFEDMAVVDDIRSIFENTNTAFEQLVFELTERHPVEDFEVARMVISGIQELGSSVALDDAGTGHGGFSYLQKLGLDVIKIDKMFVDTFSSDVTTMTIIDIIVELAKSLDMGIIAEGVESEEQVERLQYLGISAAQGYYFSPALPPEEYIKLVRNSAVAEDKFALFDATRIKVTPEPRAAEVTKATAEQTAPPLAKAS